MPTPDFTDEERLLIATVRSSQASAPIHPFLAGYLTGAVAVAACAAWYGNVAIMLAAFAILCGFRIYEDRVQYRLVPMWRSILDKYERALPSHDAGRRDSPPSAGESNTNANTE